ncbi:MAG: LysM peptidoglycan-binding domain-containing protein, partial [Oscillospiraceae bacterium]
LADYEILQSDDLLKIKVNLHAQGFVMEKQKLEILHSLNENSEKPLEGAPEALILYYGQKGENVFDIAKEHRTSPQVIAQENQLAEKQLAEKQMLLIPAFEI